MIAEAWWEVKALWGQLKGFLKENKWVPWLVILSVFVSYGVCLYGSRIGIDSEANLNDADEFLNSWYSIGRFSLVFTKNLFGMRQLNIPLANLLMLFFMVLYGIFADFMFYLFSKNDRRMKIFYVIFPALFLTHPVYVQQCIFTVQCFEVAFSMLLCLISVCLLSRWSLEGKKGALIPGVLLMVWSFGAYQAFVPFYMSAALSVYLVFYFFHKEKEKNFYLKAAICHASAFISGYVIYMLAVKAVLLWKKGFGFQGEYLEEQIGWAVDPIAECIGSMKHYIGDVIFGRNEFYTKSFLLFAVLFAAHLLYTWVRERRREYVLYATAALLLVLSPFYLAFYQGGAVLMRSQFSLPFTAAFLGAAAVAFICSQTKYLMAGATAICLLLAVNQGTTSARALYSAQMTYENDKMVAGQLISEMQAIGGAAPGQKIAMIGQYHPTLPKGAGIRMETIGYSFFEWDHTIDVGVTKRGVGFLNALGYAYEIAPFEEYFAAKMNSLNMPSWPAKGSVWKEGDVVAVKFSNEY